MGSNTPDPNTTGMRAVRDLQAEARACARYQGYCRTREDRVGRRRTKRKWASRGAAVSERKASIESLLMVSFIEDVGVESARPSWEDIDSIHASEET